MNGFLRMRGGAALPGYLVAPGACRVGGVSLVAGGALTRIAAGAMPEGGAVADSWLVAGLLVGARAAWLLLEALMAVAMERAVI